MQDETLGSFLSVRSCKIKAAFQLSAEMQLFDAVTCNKRYAGRERGLISQLLYQILQRLRHGLLKGGVGTHGQQELFGCQVVCHGLADLTDHVGAVFAHELCADDLMGVGVGDHLHKAAPGIGDQRPGIAEHDAFTDFRGDSGFLGLGLCHAYHGDLGAAVDAAGYNVHIHGIRLPAQHLYTGYALSGGDVGQLNTGGYISDGIDNM